jgi:diguanylate cyclase (GGDEF)-like protein/PAS domain S-box-containing protein
VLDGEGVIREINPAFAALAGRGADQLIGQALVSLASEADQFQAGWLIAASRREESTDARTMLNLQTPTGERRLVEATARDLRADPAVDGLVLTVADRQEVAQLRSALSETAEQDLGTGLPHRRAMVARIEAAVSRASRRRGPLTLLMLDLDHFRVINANLGHAGGDHLLATIGARLTSLVGTAGEVGRFSGDRFAVLLEDVSLVEAIGRIERIVATVREPVAYEGRSILVNLSMGVTERPAGSSGTADSLITEAELAVRTAHERGHGQVVRFEAAMACPKDRLDLEAELRTAIAERQFLVYYQPVVALDACRVVEVEALVRWQHPERGLVSPGEFIPLAEDTGLILPIGWWVMEEACRQGALWNSQADMGAITISVNLSPRMFRLRDMPQRIAAILERTGLPATRLRLEITESVMIDDRAHAATALHALKELGVQLAIDDFGIGYSSLAYLQEFPVDVIKIDRRFVSSMAESRESSAIVRSIVNLAKSLDLETTGEGIETADQLAQLRELGSDRGQGYLFSRPLPAADLDQVLAERTLAGDAAA